MIVCSPSCGVAPHSTSGGEVLERELVTALRAGGDDPHVLLARHKPAGTIPVERIPWGRGLRWWVMPFVMAPAIRRCFRAHHFEVLRAHSAKFLGPACLRANTGRPIVMHIQHIDHADPVERWALQRADRVITISKFSRRQLIEDYRIRPDRIAIVRPGVDHALFTQRSPQRWPGRQLLFVGGLKTRKQPFKLLDILKAVQHRINQQPFDTVTKASLVVVGDGPLRTAFERQGARIRQGPAYSQPAVSVYPSVRDEDRVGYYHRADVFVFPSSMEGFGMPVLEAMACGLPVVASRRGALPELVPDAWCADPDDINDFADKVYCLASNVDLAEEVGQRNYERSLEYSWERCAKETRAVYEKALM